MRKLKYILASFVLAAGLASCETEPIDEKVKDDTLKVTPILRFDLNDQQTVVTDKVTVSNNANGSLLITAKFSVVDYNDSNPESRYKPATLNISFSSLAIAHFPSRLSTENPSVFYSSASLSVKNVGNFSTANAKENEDGGYGNINEVNETGKYFKGNFDYILYPAQGSNLQPQQLKAGEFSYLKY